jgi:hypothetical protein
MSRSGAIDRIDALLATVSDPAFTAVVRGEPLAIAGSPLLAFWLTSRRETAETLTNVGSITTFTIRGYFRMQVSQDVRESVELDIWDAIYNIGSALRGDADLAGNCDDSSVGDATTGFVSMGGLTFRTITIPFQVDILEETTITP